MDFLCDACLLVEKQFTRGPSLEFVHDDCFFPGLLGSSRGSVDVVTSRGVLLGCPAQLLTFVWVVAFLFVSFFVVPFSHSLLPSE